MVKSGTIRISAREMKEIQSNHIKASLAAVKAEPMAYEALKRSVHWVIDYSVAIIDISEWEDRATAIAAYLNTLVKVSRGTYFYFPWKNISPEIYGKASTFRTQCIQLKELFKELGK